MAEAHLIEGDAAQALGATEMKHKYKLGYAESSAATLAVTSKATLVSRIRRSFLRKTGEAFQVGPPAKIRIVAGRRPNHPTERGASHPKLRGRRQDPAPPSAIFSAKRTTIATP
jgi:hypothetical protein